MGLSGAKICGMKRTFYALIENKLVRCKLVSIRIKELGLEIKTYHPRKLENKQEWLSRKLQEEVDEYCQADDSEEELLESVDVSTVLDGIALHGVSIDHELLETAKAVVEHHQEQDNLKFDEIKKQKNEEKGDFSKLVVIVSETRPKRR